MGAFQCGLRVDSNDSLQKRLSMGSGTLSRPVRKALESTRPGPYSI
jgi:hypothetical protein